MVRWFTEAIAPRRHVRKGEQLCSSPELQLMAGHQPPKPPSHDRTIAPSHGHWYIGRLGRPVGLTGECVLFPDTANFEDLERFAEVPVRLAAPGGDPAAEKPRRWTGLRQQGSRVVVSFEGIEDRTAAAAHTHWEVWVDPRDLPALEGEESYWAADLVGCQALQVHEGAEDQLLGEVVAVQPGAAHDHLEILAPGGSRHQIPFVRAFLVSVDTERRRLRLDLPSG